MLKFHKHPFKRKLTLFPPHSEHFHVIEGWNTILLRRPTSPREREREREREGAVKMQDPSNSNASSGNQNVQKLSTTPFGNPSSSFRAAHHRRAHSDMNFRLPDDLDLVSDQFDGPPGSFDEIGSEDDLFCTYMDIEKLGSSSAEGSDCRIDNAGGGAVSCNGGGGVPAETTGEGEKSGRPRHRHSNSVDGSILLGEAIEAKKAMAPDKLAELWSIDPKRAKRYCYEFSLFIVSSLTVDLSELLMIFGCLSYIVGNVSGLRFLAQF
ncbi:hypothetical protein U1Q18_050127 [Sarracenia purpurea var. burkii]